MNTFEQLLPGLWLFRDTCNVYLLKHGDRAIAIDFGSGSWMGNLPELGINKLEHIFLTHHHTDQCAGLQKQTIWPFSIHAPAGENEFLNPESVLVKTAAHYKFEIGCPGSYSILPGGIPGICYDVMVGFEQCFWNTHRLRFLQTPGHGPNACSIIIDHEDKQIVFCGDAVYKNGTIHQPFHLEWDHWTGSGALSAWEGIKRLSGICIDLLCPSHGSIIETDSAATLDVLKKRLMAFYDAKGNISAGEPDNFLEPEILTCGARKVLPELYQFGLNGYLLLSSTGEALIVDPTIRDILPLKQLLAELGKVRPTTAVVSHYHNDHCDAAPWLKKEYGTKIWLHPAVAKPLSDVLAFPGPWLPPFNIIPDKLWPENGEWQWNEYLFNIAFQPGQTWWHTLFHTKIDNKKVAFTGDLCAPSSRYNGTGGFCAYNRSYFKEGFTRSAELLLNWKPDIIAAGHGQYFNFSESKFHKMIEWSDKALKAVSDLCPSGDLNKDYYYWNK